jgi:hypothetical protein
MHKLIMLLLSLPFLAATPVALAADAITPAELEWSITSIEFLETLDLGQYDKIPGGCAADPFPRGGAVYDNPGKNPIPVEIGNLPGNVVLAAADQGRLMVLTVQAKAKEGDLPCWPSWWACDVGIHAGRILPCVAVSGYKDANGSVWNVAEGMEDRLKVSLLTRHVSEGETISLTLVFELETWQVPERGQPVKLLVLDQAAQVEAP